VERDRPADPDGAREDRQQRPSARLVGSLGRIRGARRRLLRFLRDTGARSCVVITGDTHANHVADLKTDFDDLDAEPVATELCGTSVTSPAGRARSRPSCARTRTSSTATVAPRLHGRRRHAGSLGSRARASSTTRQTSVARQATFTIEAGRPGANRSS
jgi:phosphodiesterase/alkaline phosphatase D-like protein